VHFRQKNFFETQNNMNTEYHQRAPKAIMNNEMNYLFMNTA